MSLARDLADRPPVRATCGWAPICSSVCGRGRQGDRDGVAPSARALRRAPGSRGLSGSSLETLPLRPRWRSATRLARARVLLARDRPRSRGGRHPARRPARGAATPWRPAVPREVLRGVGALDDLVDLLEQRFEAAVSAADGDGLVEAALQLGDVLDGPSPAQATRRSTSARWPWRPAAASPRTHLGASRRGGDDRARETHGGPAGSRRDRACGGPVMARAAALWAKLGDQPAARRVLERGHAEAPTDQALSEELERLYRGRQSWALLAGLLAERAAHEPDAARAVAMPAQEAADLRQTHLADGSAADLLRAAHSRAPEDADVVARLAACARRQRRSRRRRRGGRRGVGAPRARRGGARPARPPPRRASGALTAPPSPSCAARALSRPRPSMARWTPRSTPGAPRPRRRATPSTSGKRRWRWRTSCGGGATSPRASSSPACRGRPSRSRDDLARRGASRRADNDLHGAIDATHHLMRIERDEAQVAAARRLVELAAQTDRTADATAAIETVAAESPGAHGPHRAARRASTSRRATGASSRRCSSTRAAAPDGCASSGCTRGRDLDRGRRRSDGRDGAQPMRGDSAPR